MKTLAQDGAMLLSECVDAHKPAVSRIVDAAACYEWLLPIVGQAPDEMMIVNRRYELLDAGRVAGYAGDDLVRWAMGRPQ